MDGGGGEGEGRKEGRAFFLSGSDGEDQKAAAARRWLEKVVARAPSDASDLDNGGFFDGLALWRLQVLHIGGGRALCSFKIPNHLTDGDGNWRAGAIAAVIDDVGATAIVSAVGVLKASVDFNISYFSPAKVKEEVEIDAKVLYNKGKLSAVTVEIRKKGSGEPVALGRQWMSSIPKDHNKSSSKL